jgi:polar amino acid transport system ATP-binding protein
LKGDTGLRIELKNLSKQYDDRPVLNSITFEDDINTLALIGRSGCGKSTLLRILGGLIQPSGGEAWLDQDQAADNELYRKKIGFVFQQSGLFRHLSAKQNIALPLEKVHGMTKADAEHRALELLMRFGLAEEKNKKPAELSGGQQQRVAIARAVAPRPKILLLDEPTSALDPEYTTEVLNMISELKNEGMGFIIATHEMGFALHACEKVAFLSDGDIVEYGNSNTVFSSPKTEELRKFLSKLLAWSV